MKQLKELCSGFIVPQRDKPKEFGGTIPWCRIEDIEGKYLNGTKSDQYVSEETIKKMNLKIVPKGAVICACSASLGVQAIVTEPCITNQTFIGIVPKEGLLSEFLYFYLMSKGEYFRKIGTGTTIPYISRKKFEELLIPIQALLRQSEIVQVLTQVDAIIEKRKTELKAYDTLIKARFVEMFRDVKQEDTLLNLCNIIDYRGKTPEKAEDGLPFITAKNVRMHQLSIEPREYISKETYDSVMTRGFPREGDVVFTTEAPLGNVCRLPHFDTEFYVGQRIVTLQTDKLVPAYLEYALDTDEFRGKVESKSSGSTVTGIRVRLLEQLTIPVPNRALQDKFASFLSQVDKSKVVVQAALDEAQLLFDSLMQQYFG